MKYPYKNGERIRFTKQCKAVQCHRGAQFAAPIAKGTEAMVIHVDEKYVLVDPSSALAVSKAPRVIFRVPDWDSTEPFAHDIQEHDDLVLAAAHLASRCSPSSLVMSIIHEDHDCEETIRSQIGFLRASSACYRAARQAEESFHIGERAWTAECDAEANECNP